MAYIDIPADEFRASLTRVGLPDWLSESVVAAYQAIREGHLATVTGFVEELTGRPARTYREFAAANRATFAESP